MRAERFAALGALPLLAAGMAEEGPPLPKATVEVTASYPPDPVAAALDPRRGLPGPDGAAFLGAVPGFHQVRKGGLGGDPVLRGMAGSRLGLLADGEETPGGCGGRMDPPSVYLFPEAYDQVQVVKGPQTVRYRPGAWAGVVVFQHLPRRWEQPGWAAAASWTLGGWARRDRFLEVQGGGPRSYLRVAGLDSRRDDYRCGAGRLVHSAYRRHGAQGALGWTPGPGQRLELRGSRGDGQAAYADRGMDATAFRRRNLGAVWEAADLSPRVGRLEARTYWTDIDHRMDNVTLRAPGAPPGVRNPRRTTRGASLETTLLGAGADLWVLGGDALASRHDVRRGGDPRQAPVDLQARVPDAVLDTQGLYGEWTRPWGSGHRLVAGLRLDRWSARDLRERLPMGPGSTRNPTARARRRLALPSGFLRGERALGRTVWFAGLGQARRPPDYWELFPLEGETSPSAFGLRPERATQLDLGARFEGRRLTATCSLFANRVADFILIQSGWVKSTPGGARRTATVARSIQASAWGGELALEAGLGASLRAQGSLACAWGENRTDRLPLAQMPPLEARLGLDWDASAWGLGSQVRLVAPQDRVAPGQGTIAGLDLGRTPGFPVVSLHGAWRVPGRTPGLVVQAGIDNLLDRDCAEHLNRAAAPVPGYDAGSCRVSEPGRSIWVRVALNVERRGPARK